MKTQPIEWELIFVNDLINKGFLSDIGKQLIKININKQFNFKNGQRSQTDIFPRGNEDANRHMKRCSTFLIIRGMQVKTTMSCRFIPVRMVIIIKENTNNKH